MTRHQHDSPLPNPAPVAAMASSLGNLRFARHAQLLARWPVLPEPWAHRVERARLAAVDRTPGAATFGR
jgi:hypothetical protein